MQKISVKWQMVGKDNVITGFNEKVKWERT